MGNSLAHLEAARGTSEEENAEEMLRALLEREVGETLSGVGDDDVTGVGDLHVLGLDQKWGIGGECGFSKPVRSPHLSAPIWPS